MLSMIQDSQPIITIITPTLNSKEYLIHALESIRAQSYFKIESIVVDGGSTDGTIQIAEENPIAKVYTKPGSGIFSALNEGIKVSIGEYIGFLNSDDLFETDTISAIINAIGSNPDLDVIAGKAILFKTNAGGRQEVLNTYDFYTGKSLEMRTLMHGVPLMNAHFFSKRVFEKVGLFDESLPLSADREFMIRVARGGFKYQYIPKLFYKYRSHDASLTLNKKQINSLQIGREHIQIAGRLLETASSRGEADIYKGWMESASVTAIVAALKARKVPQAVKFFGDRWKNNYYWPVNFIRIALLKVIRRLSMGSINPFKFV